MKFIPFLKNFSSIFRVEYIQPYQIILSFLAFERVNKTVLDSIMHSLCVLCVHDKDLQLNSIGFFHSVFFHFILLKRFPFEIQRMVHEIRGKLLHSHTHLPASSAYMRRGYFLSIGENNLMMPNDRERYEGQDFVHRI